MRKGWYKNSVFYTLDVKTFKDSNGDGVGDFQGLISRLDYLKILGVDALWLLPFFPSPEVDNGYDVKDYLNVNPSYGNLGDFVQFMNEARERGIHVVIDLVVNHTSDQHPWFQKARSDKSSEYRDYYIWRDNPPSGKSKVMFEGRETNTWHFDEEAGQYYLHRFYKEQPDLNVANPKVVNEIKKIIEFWLELGVSGFRVDAAHIITDPFGMENVSVEELHSVLSNLKAYKADIKPASVFIGEANLSASDLKKYVGEDDPAMDILFNFIGNKNLFLALVEKKAGPIAEALRETGKVPVGRWINFLRHHDELNLELLSKKEREKVFEAFAPDDDMRIFGHGIRRRLPPMVKGDRKRLELMYSVTFSLPGIPLLNYGEEIGMGDDLSLEGRMSVRTPMQWSSERNGGFSDADKEELIRPVVDDEKFGYRKVNVLDSQRDPKSLLNWVERLIRARKQILCNEEEEWRTTLVDSGTDSVLAHVIRYQRTVCLFFHNFSDESLSVKCEIDFDLSSLTDVFGDSEYSREFQQEGEFEIRPFGYRWLRVP